MCDIACKTAEETLPLGQEGEAEECFGAVGTTEAGVGGVPVLVLIAHLALVHT